MISLKEKTNLLISYSLFKSYEFKTKDLFAINTASELLNDEQTNFQFYS